MRNRGSHSPFGSIADLATKPVNRIVSNCEKCGCALSKRKRFCLPCYDVRLQENIVAGRARRRAATICAARTIEDA